MQQGISNENTNNNKPWQEAGNHCLLMISNRIRFLYLAAGKIRSMIMWKMNTLPSPPTLSLPSPNVWRKYSPVSRSSQ